MQLCVSGRARALPRLATAWRRTTVYNACRCSSSSNIGKVPMTQQHYSFAHLKIPAEQVFCATDLSFAFVNIKPVVPGHVLISSRRVVKRFAELRPEEVSDLWLLAQRVGKVSEGRYNASALTLAIQDGAAAGQSVPHVHIHCLPRSVGDFTNTDDIYDAIDDRLSRSLDPSQRRVRSKEEMAQEATCLRSLF